MAESVVFTAIFESENFTLYLEYEPAENGAIFIVSANVERRPVSQWQERETDRRKAGRNFKPSVDQS